MADVDDGDLMVATMQMLRSEREFPPTPGQVRAAAKTISDERLRLERMEQEQAARNEPAPTTRQIAHGGNSRLREIPFERLGLEMEYEELKRPRRIGPLEALLRIEPEPPHDAKQRLVGVARHATLVNMLGRPPEVVIRLAEE